MFELLKKIFDNVMNLLHHMKCNMSCCSSSINVKVIEFVKRTTPTCSSEATTFDEFLPFKKAVTV